MVETMSDERDTSSENVSDRLQRLQEESTTLLQQAMDSCELSDDDEDLLHHDDRQEPDNTSSPSSRNGTEQLSSMSSTDTTSPSLWKVWNRILFEAYPIIILLMVLVLWPAGAFALKDLLSKTDSTFHDPVAGTPSSAAKEAFSTKYTGLMDASHNLFVVLTSTNNASLAQNSFMQESSVKLAPYLQPRVFNTTGVNSAKLTGRIKVDSYYSFLNQNLTSLASPFLSDDEHMTFLQVTLVIDNPPSDANHSGHDIEPTTAREREYFERLHDALEEFYDEPKLPENLTVGFTGLKYFSNDLRVSTQNDLHRMDSYVLPLAILLLGFTLFRQQRKQQKYGQRIPTGSNHSSGWLKAFHFRFWSTIWIFPLCGMISTVSIWAILLNTVVLDYCHIQITQFTPSIMMSLTLGMGLDYSLFLLSRYIEHCQDHHDSMTDTDDLTKKGVQTMLEQAGKVVLVSGTTLMATFLALISLPLAMLQSVGIGAALAIGSAILSNLTVVPSLLYMPSLGQNILLFVNNESQERADQTQQQLDAPLLPSNNGAHDIEEPIFSETAATVLSPEASIWLFISKQVLHPYKSVIVVLIILQFLLWPVAWQARQIDSSSISLESIIPRDAPSMKVYNDLVNGMKDGGGRGNMAPFRILLDGTKSSMAMDTTQAFHLQQEFVTGLIKTNATSIKVSGISVLRNAPIPYTIYKAAKLCQSSCSVEAMRSLNYIDEQVTSSDRMATYFMVELGGNVSPFDKEGVAWLLEARQTVDLWLQRTSNQEKVDIHIDGVAAVAHDAVDAVYEAFPLVVGSALAAIFLLLGMVFQSIVPPLRSIISICFTLAVSYGLAVLVYQDGLLNRLSITSLMAVEPELSWLVPIMSFSIMIGLALDYDVFLVTRVFEYRVLQGYGHQSSIAAALEATGGIITSAGIIMALAFGSLVLSASVALDQWAFLLTVAVLLDTFVVRTLLVPAISGWTGDHYSWYPRKLPQPVVFLHGFDVSTDAS